MRPIRVGDRVIFKEPYNKGSNEGVVITRLKSATFLDWEVRFSDGSTDDFYEGELELLLTGLDVMLELL